MKLKNFTTNFFLILSVVVVSFIFARETFAISISPLRQSATIAPGSKQIINILIKNDTNKTVSYVGEVEGFSIDAKTGGPIFTKDEEAIYWVTAPAKITLKSGEEKELEFVVNVPKSAEPGARYLALFAKSLNSEGQVAISERVGSFLFLYVAGEVREEISKVDFYPIKSFYFEPNFEFLLRLKNNGTIHVVPYGYLEIKNILGKTVAISRINLENRKILPHGELEEIIKVNQSSFKGVGPLKAEFFLTYGLTKNKLSAMQTFWFIPWQFFVILVLIFFAICFPFWIRKKRRKKYE